MVDEAETEEAAGCDPEVSEFNSRLPPQNKCPFCTTPCGNEWCEYTKE